MKTPTLIAVLAFCMCQVIICTSISKRKSAIEGFELADPDGIVTIGEHTYFFGPSSVLVTLEAAMQTCNDLGLRLLSLETEEKYVGVRDYMEANLYNSSMWTSGRTYDQSKWFWASTGQVFTYTAWADGEPETLFYCFPCMTFSYHSDGWVDGDCVEKLTYICEQ